MWENDLIDFDFDLTFTVYLFWNKVSKNNRNHHIILLFFVSQNTQMTHIQIDFNYASLQFLHDDTSQTTR